MTRTLGLDLGPNSIGWALIEEDSAGNARLIDLGARIFPEGVDNFDTAKEVSRGEKRRVARGMRRQITRRGQRKRLLRQALVEAGLFPGEPEQQRELDQRDPYELRARALTEKLAPHELGRVFWHLARRRGFLSNRKKDRKDKETQGMLAEINQLAAEMQKDGAATLGQWLYKKSAGLDHRERQENDHVRNRHTARAMYQAEFDAIWDAQRRLGHAELLTDELKYGRAGRQSYPVKPLRKPRGQSLLQAFGLHGLVFLQRTMYWPKSVVGECELERNQKRCPVADRRFQRFRMLQEVNNLRYIDQQQKPPQELPLSADQRTLLLDKLARREEMTFDQIRKALGFLESVQFNLERGKRSKLKGQTVDVQIAKAVGKAWHDRPEEQKDAIVRVLANPALDERAFVARATREWDFSQEEAEALLEVDLPSGYGRLSLMAINKLLPHLEKGLPYQAQSDPERSALHAAGYLRPDELRRRLFERLPDPKRARDCPVADLPNPVVRRALTELRKVVNAVIREYGRPDHIHLEMGRDLKTRPKAGTKGYRRYQEQLEQMRYREALREQAIKKLEDHQVRISRDNIIRYLLWQEQNETCVYSGNPISIRQLFGHDIDVDHILPRSRTLDDSQTNKVVCFRQTSDALGNHDKGNRTPNEWLADANPEAYAAVCQRAKKLPYPKYRRFLQKELELDNFIDRQLNDSRYIARLAGEYLRCLFEEEHRVLGLKGQLTAELRHQWGLDTILAELPDSPAWREQSRLRPGEKNRADHRHHAIDAVVIALTNRSRLQKLARMCEAGGVRRTGEILEDPWPNFRDDISDATARLRVSRRVERKIAGALHEETLYGKTDKPGEWVIRKPLESLSPAEVERIRDPAIRKIVLDRLREHGINIGRGKSASPKQWKAAVAGLRMPSGVPIKKVRVLKHDLTIRPIRSGENTAYVKPGSTHHLCIFEWEEKGKKKREPVFVAMLEAVRRVKAGEPLVQRDHSERPEAKFLMSLGRGEMVLADWNGEEKLLVYRTAASTQGQIYFVEHCDARKDKDAKKYVATANSLIDARKARKVTVDPLGRVRWAGD